MRKLFILFYFIPLFTFSQTSLVTWFKSDLTPTLVEKNITCSAVSGVIHQQYGVENAFFTTNNNFSSSASPDFGKYIQFKVSADSNYRIQLSSFSFSARKQGGDEAQKFQIKYSKDAGFSTSQTLIGETATSVSYVNYNPTFPTNTFVESGESMYIRVYVYNTYNNLHLRHNQTGSIAPLISGKVSLTTPVKPVANDDRTGTLKNASVNIDVLANDEYRFSGNLTAINTIKPSHGTVFVNGVNSITYKPDSNYLGYDSFYYTLTNSVGVSNSAKVEIQVIDGTEKVLVRWNKANYAPTNYAIEISGSNLVVKGENIQITNNASVTSGPAFQLGDLPNTQQFDGKLNPDKYLSATIKVSNADYFAFIKSLKLTYRGGGIGNMTIKFSKSSNFSENVYTLVDDKPYDGTWAHKTIDLPGGTYLFPEETLYFRIYTYNTYNAFFIDFTQNGESGPALTGVTTLYSPEPCTTSVSWDGTKWSGTPNINKKAILNAAYSTATNGSFEACNLTINTGKLTINPAFPVKVQNEISVISAANVEIESGGNLIQVNDNAAANNGIVSVFREIKIGKARNQFNYLGSPVVFSAGESFKTIYAGTSSVLAYKESTNLFSNFTGIAPAGKGLALKEPKIANVAVDQTGVVAKFMGTPQNGNIAFPLENSNTDTNNEFGYNMVANPYPSNINILTLYQLNKGTAKNPTLSATFYFWDNGVNNDVAQTQQGSSYSGQAYAVFNALAGKNGTGTSAAGYLNNNIIGKKTPTNIVSVGQGFIVRALAKNYQLKFNNSIRTSQDPEIKFLGKSENVQDEENRFWVKMISPANLTSSSAVIYFEGGKKTFGEEDSEAKGASDEIFTVIDDKKLSINGKSEFEISDQVSVGTQHFASGNYTIAIDKKEGIFATEQTIYLKDRQTGIITNISEGSYSFEAVGGESTGRFEIIYQPESVLATEGNSSEQLVVYKNATDFVIQSKTKKITDVELFDATVRLTYQVKTNQSKVMIPADKMVRGVYILKINRGGQITTKKIVK